MRRGRTLFWAILASVVAAAAVVVALTHLNTGAPQKTASSPVHPGSASTAPPVSESAPVVVPKTPGTYLSNLKPSGAPGGVITPGPVKISGSIYPKSISFYCNVGDPTAFPAYKLKHNARRFQATIGLPANTPPQFQAAVLLVGDGRTLRTINVSVPKPKTVDVDVTGVHTLQLQCFGSGGSYSNSGWAVAAAWGNARVSE
jgi:NPCBM/NEW2 domain